MNTAAQQPRRNLYLVKLSLEMEKCTTSVVSIGVSFQRCCHCWHIFNTYTTHAEYAERVYSFMLSARNITYHSIPIRFSNVQYLFAFQSILAQLRIIMRYIIYTIYIRLCVCVRSYDATNRRFRDCMCNRTLNRIVNALIIHWTAGIWTHCNPIATANVMM